MRKIFVELNVEDRTFYRNFSWTDTLPSGIERSQQIALEVTGARNRGNYLATYDTFHSLQQIKNDFANYYFSEVVALAEVEQWAKMISKTIQDRIVNIETKRVIKAEDNKDFTITHVDKIVEFQSGLKVPIFIMIAVSKIDLFVIDCNDLFPRYYLDEVSLELESCAWIENRKQEDPCHTNVTQ